MTTLQRTISCALVIFLIGIASATAQNKTLYQRLGGYDGLAALIDEFGTKLGGDERFKHFFAGHSANSEMRQRQLVLDLFCKVTGGPCFYIGRDLKTTHAGLGISKAHWDAAVQMFVETMNKFKIGEQEQKELAGLIAPLEKDIVEKP